MNVFAPKVDRVQSVLTELLNRLPALGVRVDDLRDTLTGPAQNEPAAAPRDLSSPEFRECEECRAKPGSPVLCQSCLQNREAIGVLKMERNAASGGFGAYVNAGRLCETEQHKVRIADGTAENKRLAACIDAASDDLRARNAMLVARLRGMVEGRPTATHNFLQRVDELVEKEGRLDEAERTVKSIATMLGWRTVPPRESLERNIAAARDRLASVEASVVNQERRADDLTARLGKLDAELVATRTEKNNAYAERNKVVAAFAFWAFKRGSRCNLKPDAAEPGWWVLLIELPTGLVSWHLKQEEIGMITPWLDSDPSLVWDGHTTEEKYRRLAALYEARRE